MPTYGYECLSCDNQFEIFQSIKADALTACDECGGTLRKRIYPVGIAFKGSGFYVNDYVAKPSGSSAPSGGGEASAEPTKTEIPAKTDAKAGTAEVKSEAKTESKAETKSESKPAAKAESKASA